MVMDIGQERLLADRITDRDRSAMKQVYDMYAPVLMPIALRYLPNMPDAEDLLQETFITAFRKIDKFEARKDGSLLAWLKTIMINKAISQFRKNRHRKTVLLSDDLGLIEDDTEPDFTSVPPEMIQTAIYSLPDGCRTVLNLYVYEGKSHREIGQLLGITEGTSASQLHRAKQLLFRVLKKYVQ